MDTNNPERNDSQVGNPEPNVHLNARATLNVEIPSVDPDPDPDVHDGHRRHNRPRSYSGRQTSFTGQRQLERDGATNAHLVRVGEKRLKEEGMEAFNKFDKEISGVDAALRLLGSTMQLFGSSVGVLHAIYRLRKSLMRLQFHVRENAARLYEGFIEPSEKREIQDIKPDMKANGHINPPRSWKAPAVPKNNIEAKEKRYQDIHGSMDQVGHNLERFMERINEISGFHDELINQTFAAFSGELKHRAAVLRRLKYRPNTAFKERINKLAVVFGQHLEGMREALKSFQKNSIPVIQLSQERRGLGLQGLSAVATFFSGINATAIQYQLNEPPTLLRSAVNGLLITSLACSAASAVSAQVVYFWRISKFSSPSKYTPGFIAHILQYTPLIYLCISVSTFMVGLSVFTFSSNQDTIVSIVITIYTGLLFLEFAIFGVWMLLEYLAFTRTGGAEWFLQYDCTRLLLGIWNHTIGRMKAYIKPQTAAMSDYPMRESSSATERGAQLNDQPVGIPVQLQVPSNNRRVSETGMQILQAVWRYQKLKKVKTFLKQYPPGTWRQSSTFTAHTDRYVHIEKMELLTAVPHHNGLVKHLAFSPDQKLLATCGWDGMAVISSIDQTMTSKSILKHVENIETSTQSQAHYMQLFGRPIAGETCVREIAWSPDGKMVATRTRKAVRVWSTKDGALLNTITANKSSTMESLAWSWKVQVMKTLVNRGRNPSHMTDNQKLKTKIIEDSQTLVVMGYTYKDSEVVGTYVVHYGYTQLRGTQVNKEIPIKDTIVISMATVNDCSILDDNESSGRSASNNSGTPIVNPSMNLMVNEYIFIGVGMDTKGDLNLEAEKFLFLFNFQSEETTKLCPLSGKVNHVSVTVPQKNIVLALVIYKGQDAYPQLWRIKVKPKDCHEVARVQSYFSKANSDFSGRGCFGGPDDIYVCCSSQDSDIFIWNRETGLLIFTIQPKNDEHIKFFTCNKLACPNFMCVSGTVDGLLSVWTSGDVEEQAHTEHDDDTPYWVLQDREPVSSPGPGTLLPEQESGGYIG